MNLDRRLLEQLRRVRWAFLAAVLAGTAVGVAAIAQARFLSRVIARVFLDGYGLNQVMPWMWGLLVVILVRSLFTWIGDLAGAAAARQIKVHIRELLTAKLFRLGPLYSQARPAGELSSIMLQGVEALDAYFSQYLPQIVLAALVPLAVLVLVFPADWLSGLILLVTGPLIPVFMFLIGSTAEQLTRQQFKALGRMSAALLDALQGLRALKELGRSRDYAGRIQEVSEQYRRKTLDVLRVTFLSALALELLGTISTAVIAVQIGLRLLYGRMDFETAFFLLVIAPDFYLPLRSLGLRFHAALNGVSAARRIFQVLDEEEPAVFQRPSEGVASRHHPDLARKLPEITFKNVKYRYPGSEQAALQGLSFTLRPGEVTALVGESGAGKSTTAAVLLRFISAQGGEVSVGGRSLAEIDPVEWRKLIAWVPQRT
jgi:ATP-binding cassette subfamily C protein CydD